MLITLLILSGLAGILSIVITVKCALQSSLNETTFEFRDKVNELHDRLVKLNMEMQEEMFMQNAKLEAKIKEQLNFKKEKFVKEKIKNV